MARHTAELSARVPSRWKPRKRVIVGLAIVVSLLSLARLAGWLVFLDSTWLSSHWQSFRKWVAGNQEYDLEVGVVLLGATLVAIVWTISRMISYFTWARMERSDRWAKLAKPEDLPKLENELRASNLQAVAVAAQIGGGIAVLVGIYFAYQNLLATREGQITDRFIRAVDQLGAKDKDGDSAPEIRLGGIYGLRRIAQDSPEDYRPIRRILNDYILINAASSPKVEAMKSLTVAQSPLGKRTRAAEVRSVAKVGQAEAAATPSPFAAPSPVKPLRADIQAALEFLGQPIRKYEKDWPISTELVNLPGAELQGVALANLHFEKANLSGVNFNRAQFKAIDINNANLDYAQLRGANLDEVHLDGASLDHAQLSGAIGSSVHLNRAKLDHAQLRGAFLNGTELKGAGLNFADLTDAYLERADLSGAYLLAADLSGAILFGAQLRGADLDDAKLPRAEIMYADLTDARLRGADLSGAFLEGADLAGADFSDAQVLDSISSPFRSSIYFYYGTAHSTPVRAHLNGADLTNANLSGAHFTDADLNGAHLTGARLAGADLSKAVSLSCDQIKSAHGNALTKLPTPLEPCRPDSWK